MKCRCNVFSFMQAGQKILAEEVKVNLGEIFVASRSVRQVLECASPLALWMGYESARGLAHSKTLPRL